MDIYSNVFDKPDEQRPTDRAARGEPSLLELSRVVTEEGGSQACLGLCHGEKTSVFIYTNMQSIAYATNVLAITGGHVHDCQQETITIQYTQRNMSLKIVVLAKQVPDTRNVGPDAMTPEGTVNRAALPAVFNPEDLNALEQALILKDKFPGSTISVVTMGLPKSAEVIREALYRGADFGYVVTDRPLGGADTLATSYTLSQAIKKIGDFDIILGGRQAIDGDTAQVGPQIAEKLGLTQVTYAEEILSLDPEQKKIVIKRHIDGGVETVEAPLPLVVTVNGSAAPCRPRNAKRVMKYKRATVKAERTPENAEALEALITEKPYLNITQWGAADIDCDPKQIGKAGSPTNVKAVKNIVFKAKESRTMTGADEDIDSLVQELLNEKIIG